MAKMISLLATIVLLYSVNRRLTPLLPHEFNSFPDKILSIYFFPQVRENFANYFSQMHYDVTILEWALHTKTA